MELLSELTWSSIAGWALGLCLLYGVGLVVYRLYFHPLAKFPGPRLNAICYWPEIYHDIVRPGKFLWEISKYHDKYGPIVRINPHELHIRESKFFDTIYAKSGRVDKYEWSVRRFGNPDSAFGTGDSELHAIRRAPMNPFFSRGKIMAAEPIIQDKLKILLDRIRENADNNDAISLDRAYCAFTGDVIMQYVFALSYDHLDDRHFRTTILDSLMGAMKQGHVTTHFPIISHILQALPRSWIIKMEPLYGLLFQLQDDLRDQVVAQLSKRQSGASSKDSNEKPDKSTVFGVLLDDPVLSPHDKSMDRLKQEAQALIGAGLATTAWSLAVGSFFIIDQPDVYKRLRAELRAAHPKSDVPLSWSDLEKLPYLSGCVRESIRLSHAISGRTPRIFARPLAFNDRIIPPGTPVSMTSVDISLDESIFPDPESFKPERWMNNPKTSDGSSLEKYLVTFSKGSRMCIGINLAYAELFHAIAGIFSNFKFELFETDYTDIELKHDFFVPLPKLDSLGVRVKVVPLDDE